MSLIGFIKNGVGCCDLQCIKDDVLFLSAITQAMHEDKVSSEARPHIMDNRKAFNTHTHTHTHKLFT